MWKGRELESSEGLTGARESASKEAYSHGWYTGTEKLASLYRSLSIGLFECPLDMAADFPLRKQSKGGRQKL